MKKIIALFLTFIVSLSILQAQYPQFLLEKGDFLEYKRNLISNYELPKYQKLLDNKTNRNYDVLNYNLELDWTEALSSEPIKFEFSGKNNITIKITEPNINKIEFDAVNLLINSVFIFIPFKDILHGAILEGQTQRCQSCSASQRSASIAAIQPVPAAVIA